MNVVKWLAGEGKADMDKANTHNGANPFFIACQEGRVEVGKWSVEEVKAEVDRATKEGWTPLYVAAQMGYLKIVKCLVEKGKEDVGKTENDRCTPLEAARSNLRDQMSAQMSSQIVECLKEKGAKE